MTPVVVPLPGSEALARRLARRLGARQVAPEFRRFPDGESYLRLTARIARRPVVIVANLERPDDKFLQLHFLAALARDLGASEVGLVCPYLPYMRQDKRFRAGEAITSTYFASALSAAVDWLVTVDPHLHRRLSLSEIYSVPTEVTHAAAPIAQWIQDHVTAPMIVGPDGESSQWVKEVARQAGAPYEVLRKRRLGDRSVRISPFRAKGGLERTPVLVDDIVSTAQTMIETVRQIRSLGGRSPCCVAVHALFAGTAYADLRRAGAGKIVTCNTVPHPSNAIDVTGLIADGVRELWSRSSRGKKSTEK